MRNHRFTKKPRTVNHKELLTKLKESADIGEGVEQAPSDCQGALNDAEWLALVERLLKLSPADLEAAIVAVRLYQRFEEGDARRNGAHVQ